MELFRIDQEKCRRDGICVASCPLQIIEQIDPEATPSPTREAAALCIRCGHCVAVCPHGALVHSAMDPAQCPPVRKEWFLSPEQAEHFLRYRRSIRVYREKPVDRETLTRLIDMARYAPSGHNLQPVRWLVIYDPAEVKQMAGLVADWMRYLWQEKNPLALTLHMDRILAHWDKGVDLICRSAPHLIIAHAPKDERSAPAACTLALGYLELVATSLGLGACWAGFFQAAAQFWPPLQEALQLPDGHSSFGTMMVGYPKYHYQRLPLRNPAVITWKG